MVTNLQGPGPSAPADPDATMVTDLRAGGTGSPETMLTRPAGDPDQTMATDLPGVAPGSERGDPTPGTTWGDYRFGRLLGRGGMGAVFAGTQVSLDRPVAIKVLPQHLSQNPDFRKRFVLEARSVAQISSPNVIQVYGAGVHEGNSYFAMEYVAGKDLAARLKAGFRPTVDEATELILQAARGLAAAGDLGIVHRDIKPSNMMVTEAGQLKIMDFGLVKMTKSETSMTMTGTVMGTVTYFSPEQGRGDPCDHRTDLYALGVCFYELLTGLLPFTGDEPSSIIYQHLHAEPKLPRDIDPTIPESHQAIVLKCMQKNPDDRYRSAHELIRDLELVRGGHQPKTAMIDPRLLRTGATIGKSTMFRRERRGSGLLVATVVVLLLAVGVGGAWQAGLLPAGSDPTTAVPASGTTPPPRAPTDRQGPGEQAPEQTTTTGHPAVDEIRAMIESDRLEEAAAALERVRSAGATDPAWDALTAELAAKRADRVIRAAHAALDRGDLPAARRELARLREQELEHAELTGLTTRLGAVEALGRAADVVRQALEEGDLSAGRAALERIPVEALAPADERRLEELRRELRNASTLLGTANRALLDGDLDTARTGYLQLLERHGMTLASQQLQVVSQCNAFAEALSSGRLGEAERALASLTALEADASLIETRRRRLAIAQLESRLGRAVEGRDLAAARELLDELRAAGADAAVLAGYTHRIELERRIADFDQALGARDLAAAEAALAAIRAHDGEQAAYTAAAERLRESRLAEDARSERVGALVTAAEDLVAATEPDWPAIERAIAAVAELAGDETPPVLRLRGLAAERRLQLTLASALAEVDAALMAGEPARMQAVIADEAHAVRLAGLLDFAGLAVAHRLESVSASPDGAVSEVVLATEMDVAPLTEVRYRYHWNQVDGTWRMVRAERIASD